MDELINYYLEESSVDLVEIALERLVSQTNVENYLEIISSIEKHPESTELDMSMYITDIAKPAFTSLAPVINGYLNSFTDVDAIEDLNEAMNKLKE